MNRFPLILAISLCCIAAGAADEHDNEVDLPRDLWFMYGQSMLGDTVSRQTNDAIIAAMPNLTPRIYKLLWEFVEVRNDAGIYASLHGLSLRTDLSDLQVARITSHLEALHPETAKSYSKTGPNLELDEYGFILGGTEVLKNYPSRAHEDLVLKILNNPEIRIEPTAVYTLAKIGTEKSIPAVRRYAARFRKPESKP